MCDHLCNQYETFNPEKEYEKFLKTKPIVNTANIYENLHVSERMKCPYLFKGYGIEIDENPMYRTVNSEYGYYSPNAYTIPTRNFPLPQKFSNNIYSEIKRLLNALLWEIYGQIPSNISRKHHQAHQIKMHPRLYEPRLLEKLNVKVLKDISEILKLEIRLISKYLERVLISRDKNRTQQTILYGFLDVIVSSRLGESSREMRFSLSPQPGALQGRSDSGRPIITDETNSSSDFNQWLHAMKLVARLPGGMPPEFRRKLWLALADKYLKSKNVDWEKEEVKCFSEQWREDDEELGIQIVKDLHRTGSSLCSGPAGTINQAKLKRILLGYARYNPEVGYCQGFNMLGALILQVMDKEEVESIKVMIYLVEGILPRGYFSGSLGGLQADMAVFRELMTCKLPRLAKHLQKLQGPVENAFEPPLTNVFTMQWFLTMFCTCLPMTCVLRVWDLVLIEGSDVLLRTALVLWSLLEERILNARTADDFYCKMGSFSNELLNGHLIDSNGLIEKVVDLGPIPELQKLRDKHLYNISPFRDKKGLQLYYSDEEGDSDEDSRMAVATAWGVRLNRRGSSGLSNRTDGKDRIALDISLLKKQYDRLRERQRQAHIILTSAVARQGSNPNQSSIQMNQLLIGRNAIVSNNGRRLGPPQGAIPPARKPSLPTAKSPKAAQTKPLRRGETLHWRDTDLSKRRRASLKWKDIKSDSSQSGQDDNTPQLTESAPSSRSSSSETKSPKASLKTHQRSDSSSYSEDSDGNSSTSTSLCDEDDHENVSSLEGSPMKKTKIIKKHLEVPHKKCLEDVLNSNEKQHTVDSQIPFIQLTTIDSPVLNANKTEIAALEFGQEDSETESNRLDYAGFVDEYSWPDMIETPSAAAFEDIAIDVTSDGSEFLTLASAITSTSQLSPIPDITTYINNSNISPLRTPISAFDYANLVVGADDSKKFDVNDEGVTNEYFERINLVERPTKLDLLYSLNEEDNIRNAYMSCEPSPQLVLPEDDSVKEKSSLESSKFQALESSSSVEPPSPKISDSKMKVLLEYSNQSSLSFIAEAKHEISSGMFRDKFDVKSLKYQPSELVPSNRFAKLESTADESLEHIFVVPSVPVKASTTSSLSETSNVTQPINDSGNLLQNKTVTGEDLELKTKADALANNIHSITETSASSESKDELESMCVKESEPIIDLKAKKPLRENTDTGISAIGQKNEESFKYTTEKKDDNINHIPSTKDLETRFKALEVSFSDKKISSASANEYENKLPTSNRKKFRVESPETTKAFSAKNELPVKPETSASILVSSEIQDQPPPKLPSLDVDVEISIISSLAKKLPSEIENPKSTCSTPKTPALVANLQTKNIVKENPSKFQNQATLVEREKEDFKHVSQQSSSLHKQLDDEKHQPLMQKEKVLLDSASSSNSMKEVGLEKAVLKQSTTIDRRKCKSDEYQFHKSYSSDSPAKVSILQSSVDEQTSSLDMLETESTKTMSEGKIPSPYENLDEVSEASEQNDKNVRTSSLSFCQDHFSDKVNAEAEFESSSVSLGSSLFEKQTDIICSNEITHSKLTVQCDDEKSLEVEIGPGADNLVALQNLDPERQVNTITHASDLEPTIQSSNSIRDTKSQPLLLSYSEDHFGERETSQPSPKKLVIEQKHDSSPHTSINDQIKTVLGDHENKVDNAAKHFLVAETQNRACIHLEDSDSLSDKVSPNIIDQRPQKLKIPSTEDLESRFMALERKFSEKAIALPKVTDATMDLNQSNSNMPKKDLVCKKDDILLVKLEDSVTTVDVALAKNTSTVAKVEAVTTDSPLTKETKGVITKTIPSTADLEHRFRELERKLSSTNINTSKTIVPQQEDLTALKQSNTVKNPSIILPNNEDIPAINFSGTPLMTKIVTTKNDDGYDQPPFIRKRIPSTEDLETRFEALEIQKSLKSPTAVTANLLSPSKPSMEFSISTPDLDIASKRKSDIPSTEDLENRFEAFEQSKLVQKPSKEMQNENCDSTIPSTKDLETRFEALEKQKLVVDGCDSEITKDATLFEKKSENDFKKVPSTHDLEARFEALEQPRSAIDIRTKSDQNHDLEVKEIHISTESKVTKDKDDKSVPTIEDLETRYEALEQRKPITENSMNESISMCSKTNDLSKRKVPSTMDLETRFDALEQQKSKEIQKKTCEKIAQSKEPDNMKLPSAQILETQFEVLEQDDCSKDQGSHFHFQAKLSKKNLLLKRRKEDDNKASNVPSSRDLENRFEALEYEKSKEAATESLSNIVNKVKEKKISKVPSTHDLEKRFDDMQIDTKILKTNQKDSKEITQKSDLVPEKVQNLDYRTDDSIEIPDHKKRKDLYKLESQSDETLTATDQTSTEFDAKTESRPTSCPEYSDSLDSNIVTTDRVLKIIEENSKILHRILKKTLADTSGLETNAQSKKSHPGLTDSLLALGNIFPRSDETISPSRMKSHSWIRPQSITLRSDDNISDRLASIKSTIKSIDTLCEEKSFRKEKCQRYIDSLFARPTIATVASLNPSIKVDDIECTPSQDRIAKRELKKDTSPRRRRDEDREEYESRVRRDMMPNCLDAPSDFSCSLVNTEQVDSEVDRINQEKQVDTQLERPLSPYYVSGYDLTKRSITPVVYIPTKLEIRHTTVTSTFYDRYLTEKHIERTFPRSKKSPISPTITKSYLDISNINLSDRSCKSAENSPSRQKIDVSLSPNKTIPSANNKRNLISTLEVAQKDLHIRSCDNILLQLRSSTHNNDIVPPIMVYNPLPTKIRKPPELGISLGLYKDYGSDESSKS